MQWLYLFLAIICEVFGDSMMKLSYGFSKLFPSLCVIVGFGLSFFFLSLALKTLPLGITYAIWAGVGLVLTVIVGVLFFGEKIDLMGLLGIAFVLCGIIILSLFSEANKH